MISITDIAEAQAAIDRAAAVAGREPSKIRRMLNVSGSIGPGASGGAFSGRVEEWVELLSGWVTDVGLGTFILWPTNPDPGQIETFGEEVAPRVRAEVARRRGGRPKSAAQDDAPR